MLYVIFSDVLHIFIHISKLFIENKSIFAPVERTKYFCSRKTSFGISVKLNKIYENLWFKKHDLSVCL